MSCELKRWTRYAVMMSSDIMKWLLKNCIKKLRLRSSVLRRRVFDVCVCLLWMLSLSHTHTHSGWHHALLSSGVVWLWLFVLQRCSLSPHLHISPDGVVETPSRSLLIDFTPLPGPRPQVCMFWCAAAALAHDLTAPSKRCFTSTLTTARASSAEHEFQASWTATRSRLTFIWRCDELIRAHYPEKITLVFIIFHQTWSTSWSL